MTMRSIAPLVFVVACGGAVVSSGNEAGVTQDGATNKDAGADACSFADHRTDANRKCAVDGDCGFVMHALDCCQARAEGVNAANVSSYDAAERAQACTCNTGCAAQPKDELGNLGTRFKATCDMGACTAHVQ